MAKYSLNRIVESIIPDVRDNFSADSIPEKAAQETTMIANPNRLISRFAPEVIRDSLFEVTQGMPNGRYRARLKAGTDDKGTNHLHDYILDKTDESSTFYFIDPEHMMGASKNRSRSHLPRIADIRPRVTNLLGLRIKADGTQPDFFALRFRTPKIKDHAFFKPAHLLTVAEQVLNTGETPDMLKEHETEIIFSLSINAERSTAQGRYASAKDLKRFLRGEVPTRMLKGRTRTQGVLIKKFLKHAEAGKFEPIEQSKVSGQDTLL